MTTLDLLTNINRTVRLNAAPQKKMEDLLAKALNLMVVGLPLSDAHNLGASAAKSLEAHIHSMPATDVKKLLKLWDPVRKLSKEVTLTEMRGIASDLLTQSIRPEVKVSKAKMSSKR